MAGMTWVVMRRNELTGLETIVRSCSSYADAVQMAGEMRDASTDDEVTAGWNYLAEPAPRARTQKLLERAYTANVSVQDRRHLRVDAFRGGPTQ